MAAYLITDADWKGADRETILRFGQAVTPVIARYGGKYLLERGAVPEPVEGDWRPPTFSIIEFPSVDAIRQLLASPEFQTAAEIRHHTSAVFRQILVQGV